MQDKMGDLREGRLDATPYYRRVDLPFYDKYLCGFLPDEIIDFHVHSIDPSLWRDPPPPKHWASRICPGGLRYENLLAIYKLLFPDKRVRGLVFGHPVLYADLDGQNEYIGQKAERHGQWGLAVCDPRWTAKELEDRVQQNGLLGIKPYLTMLRGAGRTGDVSVFDFLPHHQLEVANAHRWIVMLHLPRKDRIADPKNLAEVREICETYPELQLVLAHMGRAYCPQTARAGIPKLTVYPNLYADISANSCQVAFELALETLGPKRILYGTDMPPTAMRAKRECDGDGEYFNIVRGADWEDSRTRRRPEEEDAYTFFIYEGILAFRRAAEKLNLVPQDIEAAFHDNAARLIATAGGKI